MGMVDSTPELLDKNNRIDSLNHNVTRIEVKSSLLASLHQFDALEGCLTGQIDNTPFGGIISRCVSSTH
jgi:hypothetical protein